MPAEPNFSPGGMVPVTVHDPGTVWAAGVSWNTMGTIAVPTVSEAGLGVVAPGVYTVAPAIEFTAPSAASDAAAALITAPTGSSIA